uniref:Uncharacterized protein n=1 Tax=viral metagenome TaxID=1070528 RepID=A0A6C0BEB3_9ZZZZ
MARKFHSGSWISSDPARWKTNPSPVAVAAIRDEEEAADISARQHEKKEVKKNSLAGIRKEKYYLEVLIDQETSPIKKKLLSPDEKTKAEKKLAEYDKEMKLILAREEEAIARVEALAREAALAKAALAKVAREAPLAKATRVKRTANATVSKTDDLDDLGACFFLSEQDADAIETADATFFI